LAIPAAESRQKLKRQAEQPDTPAPRRTAPEAEHRPEPAGKAIAPADAPAAKAEAPAARHRTGIIRPVIGALKRVASLTILSSLTRRIVVLNLAALAALVVAILYLNSWRAGLIDARIQSLRVQGEIIAGAIAASASVDSDVVVVDSDRLLALPSDEFTQYSYASPAYEFPINPERVQPLLGTLVTPTGNRGRVYDDSGFVIIDSARPPAAGEEARRVDTGEPEEFFVVAWWNEFFRWLRAGEFPLYQEYADDQGTKYAEVVSALNGTVAAITRVDAASRLIVSVAVPIKHGANTIGVLLLSTPPGEIDKIVESERWGVLRIFLVAAVITFVLSLLLAGTIADPIRRLSAAAKRVQTSISEREQIPDYTDRTDEIGDLSGSLRGMTNALYNRIEAIERFAADVAHELKNPLTSLRSAVETLPRARTEADRTRLAEIIQHDVRRVDRLISDISSASRLDAEMAREATDMVDMSRLLETIATIHNDVAAQRGARVVLIDPQQGPAPVVRGQDSRLAQVFSNLVDNAISFTPEGGTVTVRLVVRPATVCVDVIDEGPGIRGDTAQVFSRFYTDRPEGEGFGNHSGLGLSISRQIVEAHKGRIEAGNRSGASGAIFTVTLPRARV